MNYLQNFTKLKNHYFALRHGQSEANVYRFPAADSQGIIISDPAVGTVKFGLTKEGRNQITRTMKKAMSEREDFFNEETIIYSSDFKRTQETMGIVTKLLNTKIVQLTPKLRERFFGDFEGQDHSKYQETWFEDEQNPDNKTNNVESTNEVLSRTTQLIVELEEKYSNKNILLISHGDPIQILQTGFMKISPIQHRNVKTVQTAELRELKLS